MSQDPTKPTDDGHNSPQSIVREHSIRECSGESTGEFSLEQPSPTGSSATPTTGAAAQSTGAASPDQPICAICQEEVTDRTVADPCLHPFCRHCIERSLRDTNECPVCRQRIARLLFNIRGTLDYDQRDVEERDRNMAGIFMPHVNEQPDIDNPDVRRRLIDEPSEFVAVNRGRHGEYLLPAIGQDNNAITIRTNSQGVFFVLNQRPEDGEMHHHLVRFLAPNQTHLIDRGQTVFSRLVSPDQLVNWIMEIERQKSRYQQQQQPQRRPPATAGNELVNQEERNDLNEDNGFRMMRAGRLHDRNIGWNQEPRRLPMAFETMAQRQARLQQLRQRRIRRFGQRTTGLDNSRGGVNEPDQRHQSNSNDGQTEDQAKRQDSDGGAAE